MKTITHTDKHFGFTSTVNIGKYLVQVEIEGLPSGSFMANGLNNYIHHTPSASAVMLEFHNFEGWKIALGDEQTLDLICDILTVRDYKLLAQLVKSHSARRDQIQNLDSYWLNTMVPELMQLARHHGLTERKDFNATMAWCNPVNARYKLHPRAIRFIQSHWPAIVAKYPTEGLAPAKTA